MKKKIMLYLFEFENPKDFLMRKFLKMASEVCIGMSILKKKKIKVRLYLYKRIQYRLVQWDGLNAIHWEVY